MKTTYQIKNNNNKITYLYLYYIKKLYLYLYHIKNVVFFKYIFGQKYPSKFCLIQIMPLTVF